MILKDFLNTLKHKKNQVKNLMLYFAIFKYEKMVWSGYSDDAGYLNDGSFWPKDKRIENHLNDEVEYFTIEGDDDSTVQIDIILK